VIREQALGVEVFLPVSAFYRDYMAARLGLGHDRFTVVKPGIDLSLYPAVRTRLGVASAFYRTGPRKWVWVC